MLCVGFAPCQSIFAFVRVTMDSKRIDVNKITDLIASKFVVNDDSLSVLKLQKLLYYVEAWHVTFFNEKLFDDDFEAWVHGPVCKEIFTRFKYNHNKFMYSDVSVDDLNFDEASNFEGYRDVNTHIENVLEAYGKFTGAQLEELTHIEDPWLNARGNLAPNEPCDTIITRESMREFYLKLAG